MIDSCRGERGRPRVVFFGTPEFAVPSLAALANDERVDLVLVVTQPDRPAGRKRQLQAPPVKVMAQRIGIPVLQPDSLRAPAIRERLAQCDADLFVVAAYGRIFSKKTLAMPRLGCVNLHASLLPAYRGASPISAAILQGDERTGVTLMQMEAGLDTGPMLATSEETIRPDDTTGSLTPRLASRAARLLQRCLMPLFGGDLVPVPQPPDATVTRPLVKDDGRIDWNAHADAIDRHVRAMWPWPRGWTTIGANETLVTMQVHRALVARADGPHNLPAGSLTSVSGTSVVQCGSGFLALDSVQLPGGRPQPFDTVVRSLGLKEGHVLGGTPPASSLPALIVWTGQ